MAVINGRYEKKILKLQPTQSCRKFLQKQSSATSSLQKTILSILPQGSPQLTKIISRINERLLSPTCIYKYISQSKPKCQSRSLQFFFNNSMFINIKIDYGAYNSVHNLILISFLYGCSLNFNISK